MSNSSSSSSSQYLANPHEIPFEELRKRCEPSAVTDQELQSAFLKVKEVLLTGLKCSVLKAGSFGKGTHIAPVKDKRSDVDIIVLLQPFKLDQHAEQLKNIYQCISNAVNSSKIRVSPAGVQRKLFRVQFTLLLDKAGVSGGVPIEFDVLPGMDVNDPLRIVLREYQLKHTPDIRSFDACLSIMQKRFVKNQPKLYHTLVRCVKYWLALHLKNWTDNTKPISYMVELVCLDIYNKSAHQLTVSAQIDVQSAQSDDELLKQLFIKVLEYFSTAPRRVIAFNCHYDSEAVTRSSSCPYVVYDPCNPRNNVADRLTDPQPLKQYAQQTLASIKK